MDDRPRIALVENDLDNITLATLYFARRQPNLNLHVFRASNQMLRYAPWFDFKCIITRNWSPNENEGVESARAIREMPNGYSSIPVILYDEYDATKARSAGFTDVIPPSKKIIPVLAEVVEKYFPGHAYR